MGPLEIIVVLAFWACAGLVLYTYAVYPLMIWLLARGFGRLPPTRAPAAVDGEVPRVSLLIAAYNEEAVIEQRIENALATEYPPEKLEIVVASDGSSDATGAIVGRYAGSGVRLLDYQQRRGKAAVLNAAMAEVTGEIVLLSDANTQVDPAAARRLVDWFRDPKIGAVCGRLVLVAPESGRNADSAYWKYETVLKRCEGRLGALLGANGAIYAIRKDVYAPIPGDTLVDDFVIPLLAKLRTGCAIVYDSDAVAWEETPADVGSEFHRRARIGAGGFQSIGILWKLLDPRRGWVAFSFLSHKVLRWLCPFFLIGLLLSGLSLVHWPLYRYAVFGQLGGYLLTLAAVLAPARLVLPRPLRLGVMFTGMNAALLVGFIRWATGRQNCAWRRTARAGEAGPS